MTATPLTSSRLGFEERILSRHEAFMSSQNGSQPELIGMRSSAIKAFKSLGVPDTKLEAWKYTPVQKRLRDNIRLDVDYPLPSPSDVHFDLIENCYQVVLVNGRFMADLSTLPTESNELLVCSLREALTSHPDLTSPHLSKLAHVSDDAFTSLNTAFIDEGLFIYVAKEVQLDRPVVITDVHVGTERSLVQPRNLFVFGASSAANIIEWQTSAQSANLENAVTEIHVGPNSRIEHLHVFDRSDDSDLVNSLFVYQEKDSHFATNHITFSGKLVRHNLHFLPDAEGCETHLNGLILARDNMHVDVHSFVDHAKPNAFSNELYKCILDDESVGVFNGKVMVRQDAQLINAYQSNRAVLLSDKAHMYSKPELEIYADDVKCSHGATTGQLDDEAIFYLKSRGLHHEAARLLLLESFAMEVVDQIAEETIRNALLERLRTLLS